MRDNPSLIGKPIAIGGPSRSKGTLCTSNYEARAFGVRAAQPTFTACQLCPELILIPPNFQKYRAVADELIEIFHQFSNKVQSISLDEAYLDVTDSELFNGSASRIAQALKAEIQSKTNLTASAGVSYNKMLAKIASDWNKPDGLFVIPPESGEKFMTSLPLSKIPGVGKVSAERLINRGFKYCGDVTRTDIYKLIKLFGKRQALELYRASQGISNSEVKNRSQRKSLGIEKTFFEPISTIKGIEFEMSNLRQKYSERLKRLDDFHTNKRHISQLYVKIRFDDFSTHTREFSLSNEESQEILACREIPETLFLRLRHLTENLHKENGRAIRLIGLGGKFKTAQSEQLELVAHSSCFSDENGSNEIKKPP